MVNNVMTGVKLYFDNWLSLLSLSPSLLLILVQFIIVINDHGKKKVFIEI